MRAYLDNGCIRVVFDSIAEERAARKEAGECSRCRQKLYEIVVVVRYVDGINGAIQRATIKAPHGCWY